jgi:hypothetical protein
MPHRLYAQVAERAAHLCEYCLTPEYLSPLEFPVDHIQPESRGGPDMAHNLALACPACNAFKGNATVARDPQSQEIVRLYHPRLDTWDDHFQLSIDTLEMVGRTAIGRATVQRLRMNRDQARLSRTHWVPDSGE